MSNKESLYATFQQGQAALRELTGKARQRMSSKGWKQFLAMLSTLPPETDFQDFIRIKGVRQFDYYDLSLPCNFRHRVEREADDRFGFYKKMEECWERGDMQEASRLGDEWQAEADKISREWIQEIQSDFDEEMGIRERAAALAA
ncbi:hypothetical protein [Lacipirellula parvula]|uniref:Uncharacterized protein n=1 Tax=Lacipirellula parvula TaxID=2650471 RepID=A0A5K7X6X0_9BACT|nr:hypothetical protein [Lacipirellula parvula]BBO31562.1 hypothetical protein PLANPX_1174 [Lacipirellula parvula]